MFLKCVFICLKVITRKYIWNNANLITEVNLLPYYECTYKVNCIKGHSHGELAYKTKISSHICASMKSAYSFTVAFERRDKMKLRFASQISSVFHNLFFSNQQRLLSKANLRFFSNKEHLTSMESFSCTKGSI